MKSLNHRYLDISCRLPDELSVFENRIKQLIGKYIHRGKVALSLSYEDGQLRKVPISIDKHLLKQYRELFAGLSEKVNVRNDLGLSHLISLPYVMKYTSEVKEVETLWPLVSRTLKKALHNLIKMKKDEGKTLVEDLQLRIKFIEQRVLSIENRLPATAVKIKKRIHKLVRELSSQKFISKERIEAEIANAIKNCDITEELVRIRSHLKSSCNFLRQEEAGRSLDFIAQEINREINTVGAKANDFKISSLVIEIKREIEKIREQVQNLE
jgi:uncharacterized protein (TIGR00255 family)